MWFYIRVHWYIHHHRFPVTREEENGHWEGTWQCLLLEAPRMGYLVTHPTTKNADSISALPSHLGPWIGSPWLCSGPRRLTQTQCCLEEEEGNDPYSSPLEVRKLLPKSHRQISNDKH